jgi:hypothetical protein
MPVGPVAPTTAIFIMMGAVLEHPSGPVTPLVIMAFRPAIFDHDILPFDVADFL